MKLGRRYYGCELKEEYYRAAMLNCERAETLVREKERMLPGFAESVA